ncbi:MAG: hypothetical protein RLZZ543_246 [Bacteroidota bacterium]
MGASVLSGVQNFTYILQVWNSTTMNIKPEIKFGLLGAVLLISWTIAQYLLGFHTYRLTWALSSGYVNFLIVLTCVWLGIKEKRNDTTGVFSVRQGVKESMYQLSITATIASLFMFVYDYHINAMWVDKLVDWHRTNESSHSLLMLLSNDPNASAIILSNTETHLCLYFLGILVGGGCMAFLFSGFIGKKA